LHTFRRNTLKFREISPFEATFVSYCGTATWNRQKYKAHILKYKALILKYMPYVFYDKPCMFSGKAGKHHF